MINWDDIFYFSDVEEKKKKQNNKNKKTNNILIKVDKTWLENNSKTDQNLAQSKKNSRFNSSDEEELFIKLLSHH